MVRVHQALTDEVLNLRRSGLDAKYTPLGNPEPALKAVDLEKCLKVKQQLLGPGAMIEIKPQSQISSQAIALLRR